MRVITLRKAVRPIVEPRRGFTLIELMICIALIAIVLAIAIPNVLSARRNANEAAAIGHLKTLSNAQTLFREADKEGDSEYDFGTLAELSDTGMIDTSLGEGVRTGYRFETSPGSANPTFIWFAVANPVFPPSTGERYFCTNHFGQIYYTSQSSLTLNTTDCQLPTGVILVR